MALRDRDIRPIPTTGADILTPTGAAALTDQRAGSLLDALLEAVGARLDAWEVRSVHRRGTSSIAVVYEVSMTDARGTAKERLYVAHVSTRPVPAGAALLDVDGAPVHVWQFPHDPYLPGLPPAVNRAEAGRLLRRVHLADADTRPDIRTRSYRPTRRAVVALRPAADGPVAAYVKLLGGRDPEQVTERAGRLAAVHGALAGSDLPVPAVLETAADAGRVVLEARPGDTLRTVLRSGGDLPPVEAVAAVVAAIHAAPALPDGADPDRYASPHRHAALLRERLPDRAGDIERIAAVAAGVSGPRATVHGDLHDGQLLVAGGGVTGLLDVDGAGTGLVAHDVGRLVAHIEAVIPPDAGALRAWLGRLRSAMAELAPARDVAAAAAGAWLGLATGPLRVVAPSWREQCDERLDRGLDWARAAT